MTASKAIYDFLCSDDNLKTAIEMAEHVNQLKYDMLAQFWQKYNSYMDQRMKGSEYTKNWKFVRRNLKKPRTNYEKSYLTPTDDQTKHPTKLELFFGQNHVDGGYPLYYGVACKNPIRGYDSSPLTTLKVVLSNRNISIPEEPWFIAYGYYKYRIFDPSFLIKMYQTPDQLIDEVTTDVWNIFCEIRPLLETINQEFSEII